MGALLTLMTAPPVKRANFNNPLTFGKVEQGPPLCVFWILFINFSHTEPARPAGPVFTSGPQLSALLRHCGQNVNNAALCPICGLCGSPEEG